MIGRNIVLAVALAATAGLAGIVSYRLAAPGAAPAAVAGDPETAKSILPQRRPDIRLPDPEGYPQAISQWDGRPLIVNFWATWCAPCRREIPLLIGLQHEHGDAGLQVIGIAIDEPEPVIEFSAEAGINYPILIGEQTGIEAAAAFGMDVLALPISVLVGRDGEILARLSGELHAERAGEWLKMVGIEK